jgi:hypothetical protein
MVLPTRRIKVLCRHGSVRQLRMSPGEVMTEDKVGIKYLKHTDNCIHHLLQRLKAQHFTHTVCTSVCFL